MNFKTDEADPETELQEAKENKEDANFRGDENFTEYAEIHKWLKQN